MRTCRGCKHYDEPACTVTDMYPNAGISRDKCRAFVDKSATTIPVRIAVAVSADGQWDAFGYAREAGSPSDDMLDNGASVDREDPNALVTFITAYVPVPQPMTPGETIGTVQE